MPDVWRNVLAEVEQKISSSQFSTWFAGIELISIDDGHIVVGVPNIFKCTQIRSRYSDVITAAFEHNDVAVKDIHYETIGDKKSSKKQSRSPETVKVNIQHSAAATKSLSTGLNPRYTIDNFVVGTNNDLAVSVANNIIEQPGIKYNPFFLYGGPGLGKTHLVQAIGNAIVEKHPKLRVLYIPVSGFYSEFIKSIRNNRGKGDEFRQKFMKVDVLIIDDFQMIVGKEQSQVEFFDIFNSLYQANKHIIVTSDRLPDQIKSVDERLASRLTWAGAFDLQLPTFEDRCAILRSKAEYQGSFIEDEAIEYIAENVKTNVRALESELGHILAVADLKGMTPLEIINEGYAGTPQNLHSKTVSPKYVVDQVAKYYKLSVKEMCSKSRVTNIKNARQVSMYLLSKELGLSTPKIALEVGVKDHTTVMHGIKKIEGALKLNFNLRDEISSIKEAIYA